MKNSFVNVAGKLPSGLVELYADISAHTEALGIEFLVVGAMARDLVLVHGFGATIERGTRDVDLGVNVANWDEFNALRKRLQDAGYQADADKVHRLIREGSDGLPWEIDIVPFGKIASEDHCIEWPPKENFIMNVLGFTEAHNTALNVQISEAPNITIPVASPAGMCLLKLVSWLDREVELKAKDAADVAYLIQTYSNIPEIQDALFEEGHMEAQDWNEVRATARKLGEDTGKIASFETLEFLKEELFERSDRKEQFVRNMSERDPAQSSELLDVFAAAFLNEH